MPILHNFVKIKSPLNVVKFKFSKFISVGNTLALGWAQSDVLDLKSKDFSKIRQIRPFRQGIS